MRASTVFFYLIAWLIMGVLIGASLVVIAIGRGWAHCP